MNDFVVNGRRCLTLQDVRQAASTGLYDFVEEWENGSDCVIAHTSGSTGKPKEIRLKKSDMRTSATMTNAFFGITSGSRLLLCLSPGYIAGKMMIVRAMEAHAEIVEEEPSNRPMLAYAGPRLDLVAMVPSQVLYMMGQPALWPYIGTLIVGGGAVAPSLYRQIVDSGIRAYATYGMTETCSHVALAPIDSQGSPFRAIPPVTFSVDDRNCLVVHTPQFSFSQLVTNDVADLLSPETFYWRGRYDNVINTGGIKVFPEEIERQIAPVLAGRRFFITSTPSEKWGSEVVLCIEGSPSGSDEQREIIVRIKALVPPYSVPKGIIYMPKFKETTSGKIIREHVK